MTKKKSKANSRAETPYSRSTQVMTHIESYQNYLGHTIKTVSVYFLLVVTGNATLFHANYRQAIDRQAIEMPKILPWMIVMSSIGFALIFFIGAVKWMKKRRSYKKLIRRFEQAPDTEILTIALFVSGCLCLGVAFITIKLFGLI